MQLLLIDVHDGVVVRKEQDAFAAVEQRADEGGDKGRFGDAGRLSLLLAYLLLEQGTAGGIGFRVQGAQRIQHGPHERTVDGVICVDFLNEAAFGRQFL